MINNDLNSNLNNNTKISLVTLINHEDIYQKNVIASTLKENKEDKIEYIQVHHPDYASEGLNRGIQKASNDLIICCHQDIEFLPGWYEQLLKILNALQEHNKKFHKQYWGVCGAAGTTEKGQMVGTHSGLGMNNFAYIDVQTLDCSLLILRKHILMKYKMEFDGNLKYFHSYGEDIALQSINNDLKVFCIDIPLKHNTKWTSGKGFIESFNYMKSKWHSKFPIIYTTVGNH